MLLIGVAYLSREVTFVLNAAFTLRGLTSGALLGGLALAVFWRKARAVPVIAGMVTSFLFMLWLSRFSWNVETGGAAVTQKVFWPWFTLIGTTVTVSVAWVINCRLSLRQPGRTASADPPQTGV